MYPLRVSTYNIRMGTADDGVNSWPHRKEKCLAAIRNLKPDIIGLQEVLDFQLDYLADGLPEYDWIGVGREDGKRKGEYAPLFFRRDRVQVKSWKTLWMSETPDEVNSMSWNTACTRIATVADFGPFTILNTHWDHISAWAREESAKLCVSTGADILVGDLNAEPDAPEIATILTAGFHSALDLNPEQTTFHGWGQFPNVMIDYIFSRPHLVASSSAVHHLPEASDHFPLVAEFRLV